MHYHAEVHIKSLEDWKKSLDDIIGDYYIGRDFDNPKGFYDYWSIGGQFIDAHIGNKDRPLIGFGSSKSDVMPVKDLPDDLTAYTLIADGQVFHYDVEPDLCPPIKQKLKELGITDGYMVTVDYHI